MEITLLKLKAKRITALFPLLLAGNLCFSSGAVFAQGDAPSWYQVEYILFKQLNTTTSEVGLEKTQFRTPDFKGSHILIDRKPVTDNQLQQLPETELRLKKTLDNIKRANDLRVIEYAGWIQPLSKSDKGTSLLIQAGKTYGSAEQREFLGKLTLTKSRFLHANVDIWQMEYDEGFEPNIKDWLTNQSSLDEDTEALQVDTRSLLSRQLAVTPQNEEGDLAYTPVRGTQLKESRRIKSGETHYLDHPYFGLVLSIEPTDPPGTEEEL